MNQSGQKGTEKDVGAAVSSGQPAIRFPAFSFSQGFITVVTSLDGISQCTRLGFKSGYYKQLTLVDSAGNQFHILSARKVRTLPLKLSLRDLLTMLGGNPRWEVELIFGSDSSQITVDEIKKLIFKSFEKEKYFWDEMCDFEEFRERIGSAVSVEQIFAAFRQSNQF